MLWAALQWSDVEAGKMLTCSVCFLFQVKTSEYSRTSRCLWRQITLLSNNGVVSIRLEVCVLKGMGSLLSFQVKTSQYSGTSRCLWGQFIRLSSNRIVSTNDIGLLTSLFLFLNTDCLPTCTSFCLPFACLGDLPLSPGQCVGCIFVLLWLLDTVIYSLSFLSLVLIGPLLSLTFCHYKMHGNFAEQQCWAFSIGLVIRVEHACNT